MMKIRIGFESVAAEAGDAAGRDALRLERSAALHVRLDGDVEARCRAAAERRGPDYAAATREQRQTDRASALSLEACTEIIVRSARDLFAAAASFQRRT